MRFVVLLIELACLPALCSGVQSLQAHAVEQGLDAAKASRGQDDFDADEIVEMENDLTRRGNHAIQRAISHAKLLIAKSRRQRKNALHLHVHNSGGTWMCSIAEHYGGEHVTQWPNNCNLKLELIGSSAMDGPFTATSHDDFDGMTCSRRMAEMQKENVTLSMIERWMDFEHGDWCPDRLIYTVIVRDPVKRAITTIRDNFGGNQDKVIELLSESDKKKTLLQPEDGWLCSHPTFNNLMVRILNGPEAMRLPIGGVTKEHLDIAKDRLAKFDAILAIPTLYADTIQLVEHLGWDHVVPPHAYTSGGTDSIKKELKDMLVNHNHHDQKLYEFGVQLARQRTDALIAKYARLVKRG